MSKLVPKHVKRAARGVNKALQGLTLYEAMRILVSFYVNVLVTEPKETQEEELARFRDAVDLARQVKGSPGSAIH